MPITVGWAVVAGCTRGVGACRLVPAAGTGRAGAGAVRTATHPVPPCWAAITGGAGGGGNGASNSDPSGGTGVQTGTTNTGGGGGGGGGNPGPAVSGGSGVVITKEPAIAEASGMWSMEAVYENVKAGTWV